MSRIQFTVPVVVEPLGEPTDDQLKRELSRAISFANTISMAADPKDKARFARKLAAKALALALHFEKIDS